MHRYLWRYLPDGITAVWLPAVASQACVAGTERVASKLHPLVLWHVSV